jgi:hypothetical protein
VSHWCLAWPCFLYQAVGARDWYHSTKHYFYLRTFQRFQKKKSKLESKVFLKEDCFRGQDGHRHHAPVIYSSRSPKEKQTEKQEVGVVYGNNPFHSTYTWMTGNGMS